MKQGLAVSRISVEKIRSQMMHRGHMFIIECPLHEESIQFLVKLQISGVRVCFLQQRAIEWGGKNDSKFIDITSVMSALTPTALKKLTTYSISDSLEPRGVHFTNREVTVARLVLCGLSCEDIASVLSISKRTSQEYIYRVLKKLGSKSVADIFLQRNVIYANLSVNSEHNVFDLLPVD